MRYFNKIILIASFIVLPFGAFALVPPSLSGTYCNQVMTAMLSMNSTNQEAHMYDISFPPQLCRVVQGKPFWGGTWKYIDPSDTQQNGTVNISLPGGWTLSCKVLDDSKTLDCVDNKGNNQIYTKSSS